MIVHERLTSVWIFFTCSERSLTHSSCPSTSLYFAKASYVNERTNGLTSSIDQHSTGYFLIGVQFFATLRRLLVTFQFFLRREDMAECRCRMTEPSYFSLHQISLFLLQRLHNLTERIDIGRLVGHRRRRRLGRWRRGLAVLAQRDLRCLLLNIGDRWHSRSDGFCSTVIMQTNVKRCKRSPKMI